jgi:hypothetical protein
MDEVKRVYNIAKQTHQTQGMAVKTIAYVEILDVWELRAVHQPGSQVQQGVCHRAGDLEVLAFRASDAHPAQVRVTG